MRLVKGLLIAAAFALTVLPARAQQADGTTVESAILDILLARGIITAEEYEELAALARAQRDSASGELEMVEASLARLRAPDVQVAGGTPGKLSFRTADNAWSLGVKGFIQTRAEDFDSRDNTKDDVNFSVPRARIEVFGTASDPGVTYELEIEANTTKDNKDPAESKDAKLEKAQIDWAFSQYATLRMGQSKQPFGREELVSSGGLQFPDRSIASKEFAPSYEPGMAFLGSLLDGQLAWQAAVSNGEGATKNNTAGTAKDGLRTTARVTWMPLGAFKPVGPALDTVDNGETRLALGAAVMRNQDSSGLNTATVGSDSASRAFEAQLLSGPFSLLIDDFMRDTDVGNGGDVTDRGRTVQAGWLIVGHEWELVARDADVDYEAKDDAHENALGLNWYRDRHNSKWQLDYSVLRNDGNTPDARRVRLQYQLMF